MCSDISPLTLIQSNFCFLLDNICFESGLLKSLLSRDVISQHEVDRIDPTVAGIPPMVAKERLLLLLATKCNLEGFIACLADVKMQHVVSKLCQATNGGQLAVDERLATASLPEEILLKEKIEKCRRTLIDRLDSAEVRHRLFQKHIISLSDYEQIMSAPDRPAQTTQLLDILYRTKREKRPYAQLRQEMQKRYSELVEEIDQTDMGIVHIIRRSFCQLLERIQPEARLFERLRSDGVINSDDYDTLVDAKKRLGDSAAIERMLILLSVKANRKQFDLLIQSLKAVEQSNVAAILETEEAREQQSAQSAGADVTESMESLNLSEETAIKDKIQQHCAEIVYKVDALNIRHRLYESGVISLCNYEEILSLRSNHGMKRLLALLYQVDAEKLPFTNLRLALVKETNEELVKKIDETQQVKNYLAEPELRCETDMMTGVWGVGVMRGILYVVLHNKNMIQKYNADQPDSIIGEIVVPGLGWPTDLAVDVTLDCLYVSDRYGLKPNGQDDPGMFVVAADSGNATRLPLDVTPAGLSFSHHSGRLLVICEKSKEERSLRFFRVNDDGTRKLVEEKRIDLSMCERYLLQAAELSENRIVISQFHKSTNLNRIVVVDDEGSQICAFGDCDLMSTPLGLNSPWSLLVDRDGLIIANDCDNNRVILLQLISDRLELRRDLISALLAEKHARNFYPRRLDLDENAGLLYVGGGCKASKAGGAASPVVGNLQVWRITAANQ